MFLLFTKAKVTKFKEIETILEKTHKIKKLLDFVLKYKIVLKVKNPLVTLKIEHRIWALFI